MKVNLNLLRYILLQETDVRVEDIDKVVRVIKENKIEIEEEYVDESTD